MPDSKSSIFPFHVFLFIRIVSFGETGYSIMKIVIRSMIPDMIRETGIESYSQEDLDFFIARLAIPHATLELIRVDYTCGRRDARHIARVAGPFGAHEYPLTAACATLRRLEGVPDE